MSVQSTSIPPKETVTYTKQTQTAHTSNERDGEFHGWQVNIKLCLKLVG